MSENVIKRLNRMITWVQSQDNKIAKEIENHLINYRITARDILRDEDNNIKPDSELIYKLIDIICEEFEINAFLMMSESRDKKLVDSRDCFFALAKKYTSKSFVFLGKAMGDRDHSTVIAGINRFKERINLYNEYRLTSEKIELRFLEYLKR